MEYEHAYLAGVIDSDGAISIIKRLRQSTLTGYQYRELVQITWLKTPEAENFFMTLKKRYGGSVFTVIKKANEYGQAKPVVKYTAEATATEKILRDVYPYLILKADQAAAIIEMRELKSNRYGRARAKPQEVWDIEDALYTKTLKLKARGIAA